MKKVVMVDRKHFASDGSYERSRLAPYGIEYVITQVEDDEDFIAQCRDADAVIVCYAPANRHVVSNLPNTKLVARTGVGFEVIDVDACTDNGIIATNIPHFCAEEVAETTIGHVLNIVRKIAYENERVKKGDWFCQWRDYPYTRLSTQKIGMVGFGNIARKTAGIFKAFGCSVMAYDPYLPDSVFTDNGVERAELAEVCAKADIITIHVPHNPSTHHLIGAEQFAMMKDGVIVVNTARGGLVDTEALFAALDSGKLRAYGTDVLEEEPPKEATKKILTYDNVFITPHSGAQSPSASEELIRQLMDTVITVVAEGKMPDNALNKKALLEKGWKPA